MEQMQGTADQARQKAQEVGGKASDRAREQVDQRSTEAGERVSSTAGDIRSVGEELRKQGKDRPAKIADQVAERAERVGSYLRESDSNRILNDVEEAGRRQPWAVVAGGLLAGFVASRFLKASSRDRYQASRSANGSTSHNGAPRGGPYSGSPSASSIPVEPPGAVTAPSRSQP